MLIWEYRYIPVYILYSMNIETKKLEIIGKCQYCDGLIYDGAEGHFDCEWEHNLIVAQEAEGDRNWSEF